MMNFFDNIIARVWNRLQGRRAKARSKGNGTTLGFRVIDGHITRSPERISDNRRTTHLALLGKTGTGKSSLLRWLLQADAEAGRGFLVFDLHGDLTPFVLGTINGIERRRHCHLSDRLVIVDPTDSSVSVGINPLEADRPDFVRIAEFSEVLKRRWSLDHFGARTDELLRNSLFALSASRLTLLELTLLLTNSAFRVACLKHVDNAEVRQFFEVRYNKLSEAMQTVMREPILNKISTFSADEKLRCIVGQQHSTVSLRQVMDEGCMVIVNLNKGRLGEQALTLGSLIFTMLKNAIFSREKRDLFTIFADEVQNFASLGAGIETVISESRKYSVSLCFANQFLAQLPNDVQAAVLSAGSHVYFQLSSTDANQVAQALDGGKPLAERLKKLPQRHAILKSGADRLGEIRVPDVHQPHVDYTDLLNRSRGLWARPRTVIEREISERHAELIGRTDEVLHAWK